MRCAAICSLLSLMLLSTSLPAQEWTRFRGPNGDGQSQATTVPGSWTADDYNWKVELPGVGHSSPVIWKDRIYLLSADPTAGTRYVLCVNAADGKTIWKQEFVGTPHHLHALNSYASCTPAVDADHVYVAWSNPKETLLKALDHQGHEVWSVDMGPWVSQHGYGSSPVVVDDIVVITKSQEVNKRNDGATPGESFVLAVDRKTGKERWKTARTTDTTTYSTPCIRNLPDGTKEIVCCSTAEGIFALDPKTGKDKWALKVFSQRTVSSPLLVGDFVVGTTGSGGGGNYIVAVKPGEKPEEVYRVKTQAPYVPTPVQRGDKLFLWFDGGIVTCIDTKTAQVHWRERIGGKFWGSPICVADKIYCISEAGEVVVLAAEDKFKEISRIPLGDGSHSTPAVSGGRMYLRTYSHLFSIGGKST
ncbi:MAG TPA: PQQ-binding-like beta-propeller repeat protein [Pirellulaceae bacterium]|nr:PQQ-binding-like beta-propeller repeat protein [Pirellulaceae bacterium]